MWVVNPGIMSAMFTSSGGQVALLIALLAQVLRTRRRWQVRRAVEQLLEPLQALARGGAHASSSRSSQALAKRRSRSTVAAEVPVAAAIAS